ncbi:MAG: hypothetical protein AAF664_16850 [Planctomycetota bacterium]
MINFGHLRYVRIRLLSFDQSVVLWCIVVPALITTTVFFVGRVFHTDDNRSHRNQIATTFLAGGWWLAIALPLSARQDWAIWPIEFWHWPPIALFFWALATPALLVSDDRSWKWMLVVALSSLTAWTCLPTGDAWEDTFPAHGVWGIALTLSMTSNAWALETMARRNTQRWVLLVSLASLGGPTALAASSYASLTEWGVAILTATGVLTILTLALRQTHAWICGIIASAAAMCVLAAGRFQTFEEHPQWLYGLLLFQPTIVSLIDRVSMRRSILLRVATAAALSSMIVGTSVWFFLIRETESW